MVKNIWHSSSEVYWYFLFSCSDNNNFVILAPLVSFSMQWEYHFLSKTLFISVPDIVLGARDRLVNKTEKISLLSQRLHF